MQLRGFPILLLFLLCCWLRSDCQDLIRATYCWNQDFRLDCNRTSILATHEAYFTNDEQVLNSSSCQNVWDGREPCVEDIRISINKRCSGMSHCHYNLTEDHPERQCRCKGVIVVVYTCVPETQIRRYCNTKISGSSGYISSPGYPRFHPKVPNCTWNIESPDNQHMKISILDLDMRPGNRIRGRELCPDSLTILQNYHKIRTSCGHANNMSQIPILTGGEKVQVTFSTQEFLPSRGFLLYYRYNGCTKLPPPKLGYNVYSNNRSALYMCCKGHLFNDTLTNSLLLHCVDGSHWNGTVSPCLSVEEIRRIRSNGSLDFDNIINVGDADVVEVYLKKNKYIEEILIPAACVVGLVFGNIALILVIQKIRKRRKSSGANHNGRSTRPQTATSGGTMTKVQTATPQTLHVPLSVSLTASTQTERKPPPVVQQRPVAPPPVVPQRPVVPPSMVQQRPVVRQKPDVQQRPPELRAPRVLITDL